MIHEQFCLNIFSNIILITGCLCFLITGRGRGGGGFEGRGGGGGGRGGGRFDQGKFPKQSSHVVI